MCACRSRPLRLRSGKRWRSIVPDCPGCVSPADARHRIAPARIRGRIRRTHLLKTGGRKAWRYASGFGDEATALPQSSMRDRSGISRDAAAAIAPAHCRSPLRQPRRHYAAPASSDDAHAAPAHGRFAGAVASDAPRDGLPRASRPRTAQRGLHPPAPRGPCQPWRQPAHPEPWGNGSPDGSPSRRKRHRRQCRVPRRPAATRHETGVVSRVPRGSRNAQAFGTDRNTDLTDDTPATTKHLAPGATDRNEDGTRQQQSNA